MNFANGQYAGWEYVPPQNHGQLVNSAHIYNICYINDTILVYDEGYPWKIYNSSIIKFAWGRNNFPWVLYARKLRGNR